MTQQVSDEVLGKFARQQNDWFRRVREGSLDPEAVSEAVHGLINGGRKYLRHLQTITLAPTKGDAALVKATKVFTGFLDSDFKNWGTDVEGEDTAETKVDVYEMVRDGKFQTLYGSLGDPRKLCLTQGQIEEFCRSHRDSLRQEGYGTFFLFEVNGELFVAFVAVLGDRLDVGVNRFECGHAWNADDCRRLVVQQQTA